MVSVIMPCYNSEHFVGRAIESVLKQIYQSWELLLVDNNSTDNTKRVLEQYQQKYPDQIRVFSETQKGAPAARNKGLKEAKGEWIQFLDADDELTVNRFELFLGLPDADAYDIITSNFTYVNEAGTAKDGIIGTISDDVWVRLINSQLGRTSAIMWKKDILYTIGGWDLSKTSSQEYNLLFSAMKKEGKVLALPGKTAVVYETSNSISRSVSKDSRMRIVRNYIQLRKEIRSFLSSTKQLTAEREQAIDQLIFDNAIQYFKLAPVEMFANSLAAKKGISFTHRLKCYKMAFTKLLTK